MESPILILDHSNGLGPQSLEYHHCDFRMFFRDMSHLRSTFYLYHYIILSYLIIASCTTSKEMLCDIRERGWQLYRGGSSYYAPCTSQAAYWPSPYAFLLLELRRDLLWVILYLISKLQTLLVSTGK